MEILHIVGGGAGLLLLSVVVSYNRFVNQRNLISNSWSNIDTELNRRYDLIPNLVETVKGYAAHERTVLEEVTKARNRAVGEHGSPEQQARTEGPLVAALPDCVQPLVSQSKPSGCSQGGGAWLEVETEVNGERRRVRVGG